MKRTIKHILTAGPILGACLLAAVCVRAQVPQTVSYSGIEIRQGATKDNGIITVIEAPSRYIATTETLLEDLARDETTNGTWFNAKARVPVNARLVATFAGLGDFSSLSFKVVNGTNAVDVSNILSASASGTNGVSSSIYKDANGQTQPPFITTDYHPYTITYDSTGAGGTLKFTVTGLAVSSATATKPNATTGNYFEKDTFCLADGTGGGVDRTGVPFVMNGVTITASAKLQLVPILVEAPSGLEFSYGAGTEEFSSGAVDTMVNVSSSSFQFIPATIATNQ